MPRPPKVRKNAPAVMAAAAAVDTPPTPAVVPVPQITVTPAVAAKKPITEQSIADRQYADNILMWKSAFNSPSTPTLSSRAIAFALASLSRYAYMTNDPGDCVVILQNAVGAYDYARLPIGSAGTDWMDSWLIDGVGHIVVFKGITNIADLNSLKPPFTGVAPFGNSFVWDMTALGAIVNPVGVSFASQFSEAIASGAPNLLLAGHSLGGTKAMRSTWGANVGNLPDPAPLGFLPAVSGVVTFGAPACYGPKGDSILGDDPNRSRVWTIMSGGATPLINWYVPGDAVVDLPTLLVRQWRNATYNEEYSYKVNVAGVPVTNGTGEYAAGVPNSSSSVQKNLDARGITRFTSEALKGRIGDVTKFAVEVDKNHSIQVYCARLEAMLRYRGGRDLPPGFRDLQEANRYMTDFQS